MNLLSLGAGGSKCVVTLKLLMHIEDVTKIPIYQLFDFVGGSSVGTLVGSGLLLPNTNVDENNSNKAKYTAHELFKIITSNLTNCFSWTYSSYIASLFGLVGPVYTKDGLTKTIEHCCGDAKLGDLLKPVIFPTYDKNSNKNYYFDKVKNKDLLLSDVILSCTAAPTFFPSHKVLINEQEHDFIDSGLVSQSSMRLVVLEAIRHNHLHKHKIFVLNVGTGVFALESSQRDGLLYWARNIATTFMNASYENEIFELSLILPKEQFFIMDVPLDLKYYQMDNISQDAVDYYIRKTDEWIENNKQAIDHFCCQLMMNKGF
jgi:patatin-like phospholipase/acyl hydrolase